MTPEESIEIIEKQIVTCEAMIEFNENFDPEEDNTKFLKEKEALLMAADAIKEVQQYRKIGTVEECREAVEKQKPKKPEVTDRDFDYYKCPVCGEYIWATDNLSDHKYCLNCGQVINWEESE